MSDIVYDKTAAGREEIATRKFGLAPRLRTLLVLVDGKQDAATLLGKVAGIGLTRESFAELVAGGFIEAATPPTATPPQPPTAEPENSAPLPEDSKLSDTADRFQALYQFYTDTIRSNLGLRGYSLQLKVEKAASLDDFRALRQVCLDAVRKSKGAAVEQAVRERLDQLI